MSKIKVNKQLTVSGVANIPSGSYVRSEVAFDKYMENAYLNYTWYKNGTNYDTRVEVTGTIDGIQMNNRIIDIPDGTIPTLDWIQLQIVADLNTQLGGDYAEIVA